MVWRFWLTLFGVALVSINLYLTVAVYVDAKKRGIDQLNLPPGVWALVTFLLSFMGFFHLLADAPFYFGHPGPTPLLSVGWPLFGAY